MATNEIHVGDTPLITVTFLDENGTAVDLTPYSGHTLDLDYKKPSGTTGHWSLTSATPASGVATYQVVTADFDEEGDWQFQGHLSDGGGTPAVFHSDITTRKIHGNLI